MNTSTRLVLAAATALLCGCSTTVGLYMPPGRDDPDHIEQAFDGFKTRSAKSHDLVIEGDLQRGSFTGVIEGTYERREHGFFLDVTYKPAYATTAYITERLCKAAWMWESDWRELDAEALDERLEEDYVWLTDYAERVFADVLHERDIPADLQPVVLDLLRRERRRAWDLIAAASKRKEELTFEKAYEQAWSSVMKPELEARGAGTSDLMGVDRELRFAELRLTAAD